MSDGRKSEYSKKNLKEIHSKGPEVVSEISHKEEDSSKGKFKEMFSKSPKSVGPTTIHNKLVKVGTEIGKNNLEKADDGSYSKGMFKGLSRSTSRNSTESKR